MTYPQPFNYFGGATILQGDPSYFFYSPVTDTMHYTRPAGINGWPPAEGRMSQTVTFDQDWALNISMSYFPGPSNYFDARLTVDGTVIFEHTYSSDGSDWGGSVVHVFAPGQHTIEFYFRSPTTSDYTYGGFDISIGIRDYTQLALHPIITGIPNPVDSGQTSRITVHVDADILGPMSDVNLDIATIDGNIDQTNGVTDIIGELKLIYTAPITYSQITDTISANASKLGYLDGTGSNQMTILSTLIPILIVTISECPDQLNSGEISEITAHVIDYNNIPVNGATVEISTTGGSINISSGMTDSNGNITIIYMAPIVATIQTYTISAVASNANFTGTATAFKDISVNPII